MDATTKNRLRLWLRAEQAAGLDGVKAFAWPTPARRAGAMPSSRPVAARPVMARPVVARPGPAPSRPGAPPSRPAAAVPPAPPAPITLAPNALAPRTPPPPRPPTQIPLIPLVPTEPFDSPELPTDQKIGALDELDRTQVTGCVKCGLCQTRTHTVFGEGDVDAKLMFIGEGPGENEDLTGRPFVGRGGELLEKQIGAMGLKRSQVYITNIVKCRPPNNRIPIRDEVATCSPYLLSQIEIVRPKVIVTLGLPATQFLLAVKGPMKILRGVWHTWRAIDVMPTYHPAYLLRNYTADARGAVWSDLQQVMARMGLPPAKGRGGESE